MELSRHYQVNPNPNKHQKASIASELGMTLEQVELWFMETKNEEERKKEE